MKRFAYLGSDELLVGNASPLRERISEQAVAEIAVHICGVVWLRETPAPDEFE
jgi:hypothetical protein